MSRAACTHVSYLHEIFIRCFVRVWRPLAWVFVVKRFRENQEKHSTYDIGLVGLVESSLDESAHVCLSVKAMVDRDWSELRGVRSRKYDCMV